MTDEHNDDSTLPEWVRALKARTETSPPDNSEGVIKELHDLSCFLRERYTSGGILREELSSEDGLKNLRDLVRIKFGLSSRLCKDSNDSPKN